MGVRAAGREDDPADQRRHPKVDPEVDVEHHGDHHRDHRTHRTNRDDSTAGFDAVKFEPRLLIA